MNQIFIKGFVNLPFFLKPGVEKQRMRVGVGTLMIIVVFFY